MSGYDGEDELTQRNKPPDKADEMEHQSENNKRQLREEELSDDLPEGSLELKRLRHVTAKPFVDNRFTAKKAIQKPSFRDLENFEVDLNSEYSPTAINDSNSNAKYPVIRIMLSGESKVNDSFKNPKLVWEAKNKSILHKKVIQGSVHILGNKKSLRLEVANLDKIDLGKIVKLRNWEVICKEPTSMLETNCSYGVIKGVCTDLDMDYLVNHLEIDSEEQETTSIREAVRIAIRRGGETKPSETVKITFEGPLPRKVYCHFSPYKVFPYIFPLIKCTICKEYGHTRENCRQNYRCYNCSGNHNKEEVNQDNPCSKRPFCFYCKESHRPHDQSCEVHKEAIEINRSHNHSNNREVKQKLRELNARWVGRGSKFEIQSSKWPQIQKETNSGKHKGFWEVGRSWESRGARERDDSTKSMERRANSFINSFPAAGQKTPSESQQPEENQTQLPFQITPISPIHGSPIQERNQNNQQREGGREQRWETQQTGRGTREESTGPTEQENKGRTMKKEIAHRIKKALQTVFIQMMEILIPEIADIILDITFDCSRTQRTQSQQYGS